MANTMFGAMSGVRSVNWGKLIHEYVEKSTPHIGRKPSDLPPYILHLYQHYDCFTAHEEDLLTIAADDVVYKLGPEAKIAETRTEDSSDPAVPKEPPVSPTPRIRKPASPPPPPLSSEAGPSWEAHWRDVDLSARDFPEAPFKRIHDELAELQMQYYRMEHRGESGPGQLRTRKYSPGAGKEGGPEGDREVGDGESPAGCTCGCHDSGAEPE